MLGKLIIDCVDNYTFVKQMYNNSDLKATNSLVFIMNSVILEWVVSVPYDAQPVCWLEINKKQYVKWYPEKMYIDDIVF